MCCLDNFAQLVRVSLVGRMSWGAAPRWHSGGRCNVATKTGCFIFRQHKQISLRVQGVKWQLETILQQDKLHQQVQHWPKQQLSLPSCFEPHTAWFSTQQVENIIAQSERCLECDGLAATNCGSVGANLQCYMCKIQRQQSVSMSASKGYQGKSWAYVASVW